METAARSQEDGTAAGSVSLDSAMSMESRRRDWKREDHGLEAHEEMYLATQPDDEVPCVVDHRLETPRDLTWKPAAVDEEDTPWMRYSNVSKYYSCATGWESRGDGSGASESHCGLQVWTRMAPSAKARCALLRFDGLLSWVNSVAMESGRVMAAVDAVVVGFLSDQYLAIAARLCHLCEALARGQVGKIRAIDAATAIRILENTRWACKYLHIIPHGGQQARPRKIPERLLQRFGVMVRLWTPSRTEYFASRVTMRIPFPVEAFRAALEGIFLPTVPKEKALAGVTPAAGTESSCQAKTNTVDDDVALSSGMKDVVAKESFRLIDQERCIWALLGFLGLIKPGLSREWDFLTSIGTHSIRCPGTSTESPLPLTVGAAKLILGSIDRYLAGTAALITECAVLDESRSFIDRADVDIFLTLRRGA